MKTQSVENAIISLVPNAKSNLCTNASAAQILADIKNNDHFTLAIRDHDNDYANTDTATISDIIIDFDTTITLDYTAAATGYTHDVSSVAAASIGKVNTVAAASIGKINSVD